MRKRIVLGAVLGALILMVAVPLAVAAVSRDVTTPLTTTTPGATWMFKMKGIIPGSKTREMNYRGFAAFAAANPTSFTDSTDPANPAVYSGVELWKLVGLVDDKHPGSFNTTLATTGAGYIVRVIGVDGFAHDFTSADVASKNIIVASKVAIAGAAAKPLPYGTAKYKGIDATTGKVSFSPAWPLKLVGADLTSGSMKIGGISQIVLLPVPATTIDMAPRDVTTPLTTTTPGATWMFKMKGIIPGSKTREMNYRGFAAFAAANPTSFTDSTDPANPAVYSGVELWKLVGLVDDKHPGSFNTTLATTGAGYIVRVIGVDGFAHDFTSADVASKNIIVASKVAIAGAAAKPLPYGTAKYKGIDATTGKVSFSPAWPLKLVGADLTSGSMKIGGISQIVLLPVPATK